MKLFLSSLLLLAGLVPTHGNAYFKIGASFPNDIAAVCTDDQMEKIENVMHNYAEVDAIASQVVGSMYPFVLAYETFGAGTTVDHDGNQYTMPTAEEAVQHMSTVDEMEDKKYDAVITIVSSVSDDGVTTTTISINLMGRRRRLRAMQKDLEQQMVELDTLGRRRKLRVGRRNRLETMHQELEEEIAEIDAELAELGVKPEHFNTTQVEQTKETQVEQTKEAKWTRNPYFEPIDAASSAGSVEQDHRKLASYSCPPRGDCPSNYCSIFCYGEKNKRRLADERRLSETFFPSDFPSEGPTASPSAGPTLGPSEFPSIAPSIGPTSAPSSSPSGAPSGAPTPFPSTSAEAAALQDCMTTMTDRIAMMEDYVTKEVSAKLRFLARHEIAPCLGYYWEITVEYKTNFDVQALCIEQLDL